MKSFATFIFCLLISAAAAAPSVQAAPPVSAEQMAAIYPGVESLYLDLRKSPELAFHEQQTETAVLMELMGG
jgi:outer membrane lipoprotein-sorting protein